MKVLLIFRKNRGENILIKTGPFNFRLRVWKEGWWKSWTPQIVLGADDPGTHDNYGGWRNIKS